MERLFTYVDQLNSLDSINFNKENFYLPANKEKFSEYVKKVLFKYYKKYLNGNSRMFQTGNNNPSFIKMNDPYKESFYIYNNPDIVARFPTREKLIDELATINLLARCINLKFKNRESLESGIIPTFNELEYIKVYYPELIDLYYLFIKSCAIDAAKKINGENPIDDKKRLEIILANYSLETKQNYDINYLNKINCNKKELRQQLQKKGYTF